MGSPRGYKKHWALSIPFQIKYYFPFPVVVKVVLTVIGRLFYSMTPLGCDVIFHPQMYEYWLDPRQVYPHSKKLIWKFGNEK